MRCYKRWTALSRKKHFVLIFRNLRFQQSELESYSALQITVKPCNNRLERTKYNHFLLQKSFNAKIKKLIINNKGEGQYLLFWDFLLLLGPLLRGSFVLIDWIWLKIILYLENLSRFYLDIIEKRCLYEIKIENYSSLCVKLKSRI